MGQVQRYFANRREFFLATGALAAGAALAPGTARAFSEREIRRLKAQTPIPEAAWERLIRSMPTGRVLRPDDADYRLIVLPNNLRYADVLPQGVARCASEKDVVAALLWAQQNHVPLITRGGGHSYAGYSTTEGLMIETSLMKKASYDARTGVLSVQAGARNRDLYTALALNKRAVTHGRCPSVGAAGFLLGGGIGFNMRARGLACDQLTGARIVTPDGVIHDLSPASTGLDKDLFWAVRGMGGGNLGVSTRFDLKTFDVSAMKVTVFSVTWTRTPQTKSSVSVARLGAKLMETLDRSPEGLGSRVSFGAVTPDQVAAGYDVPVSVLGQFAGPRAELERILKSVTDLVAPTQASFREVDYWDAQTLLHEDGFPTFYQERSAFVNRPFGEADLEAGLAHLRRWPGTYGYCDLRFFQTGGQVNKPHWSDTAFVHRDSRWLMVVGLYWNESDDHNTGLMTLNHAWQDDFYAAMRPRAGGGAYQNFADPSLVDYRQAYYGGNLGKLQALKAKIDPAGVFNFPQAI